LLSAIYDIQPYVLPGPVSVFQTLIGDWGVLSQSLLATLTTHGRRLHRGCHRRNCAGALFNLVAASGIFAVPYAVILQARR